MSNALDFLTLQGAIVWLPVAVALYAYGIYPGMLWLIGVLRTRPTPPSEATSLPTVTIVLLAYNEAAAIEATLEALLRVDYPRELLTQLLVVSDSSIDGTDEIVARYASRGVELIRTPRRMGKTAAENHTLSHLRGEIVLNTDAAVRVHPAAVRALVESLADPRVGLASGIDISVSSAMNESNAGESGYVGYEMWVRELETRAGGIIGASGCLFAIRRELHVSPVPTDSLRDFAAPLMVKTRGFKSVSVPAAVCYVPRTASLRAEYRRKVRTFALGMGTLKWQRRNLNPANDLLFAWKLFSHKVCRYLLPWTVLPAVVTLAVLGDSRIRLLMAATAAFLTACVALALWWPFRRRQPRWLAFVAISVASSVAVLRATLRVLRGDPNHLWEPTRRNPPWQSRRLNRVTADTGRAGLP